MGRPGVRLRADADVRGHGFRDDGTDERQRHGDLQRSEEIGHRARQSHAAQDVQRLVAKTPERVEKALRYEITRQKTMVSRDIEVKSETRHWDDARKVTKESRTKEEEQDYRYFPEPDIPMVVLGSEFISFIKQSMPELPDTRKERFMSKYGLSAHIAQVLIGKKELADFFESTLVIYFSPKEIANWIVTDLMSFIDERQKKEKEEEEEEQSLFAGVKVGPEHIADLTRLVDQAMINRTTAKQILGQIVRTGEMPSSLATKMHASRIDDVSVLAQAVQSVFEMEQAAVQDARRNANVANFLLGKVMQITKGKADPKVTLEMIQKKLKED
mgnify:CR=1 FL=1